MAEGVRGSTVPPDGGLGQSGLGLMKSVRQPAGSSLLLCVSETPLAFTSAPGCTVLTDLKDLEAPAPRLTPEGTPEVHPISQDPLHYSITSASAVQKIRELEAIIAVDPGKKQHLRRQGLERFITDGMLSGKGSIKFHLQ